MVSVPCKIIKGSWAHRSKPATSAGGHAAHHLTETSSLRSLYKRMRLNRAKVAQTAIVCAMYIYHPLQQRYIPFAATTSLFRASPVHGLPIWQSLPSSLVMAPCGGAWPAADPLRPAQLHSSHQLPCVVLPLRLWHQSVTMRTMAHRKHHHGQLWLLNVVVPQIGTR